MIAAPFGLPALLAPVVRSPVVWASVTRPPVLRRQRAVAVAVETLHQPAEAFIHLGLGDGGVAIGVHELEGPHGRRPGDVGPQRAELVQRQAAVLRELLAATPEIAASTGSACHEGIDLPSPVLTAMGLAPERALSALRLTLGRWTSEHDIIQAATALAAARL